jgi:biotin-dependent carboxylase-like uncharacterized protein
MTSMREVRVIQPGLLTTVQDARGRPGLGRFGIPQGGALDPVAARLANHLVGNTGPEPVLELTLQGPVLEWTGGAHIGLAGADLDAVAGGLRLAPGHSYRLPPGARLAFEGARTGARAYLAVQGGFAIEAVLGSAATDRRSGFGGFEGRALRAGDVLPFPASQSGPLRSVAASPARLEDPIQIVAIPNELGWFARAAMDELCATTWTVGPDSDRNGIRLTGARLTTRIARIPSLGMPVGSVQVPPSGEPIVTLVDGPVTGGYPVIGLVPRLDHGRLAQLAPGGTIRFRGISVEDVRRLAEGTGPAVTEIDEGDLAAGWTG